MAEIIKDRMRDTSTTTGTGPITVSGTPPAGYDTFSEHCSASDRVRILIVNQDVPTEWEVSRATYSDVNELTRTDLEASSTGSAINFSAGTKDVINVNSALAIVSPKLVAPELGTPASGVMTNVTGLPAGGLTATATDKIFGRSSSGGGAGEEIACTAFARSILDDADEAAFKATTNLEVGVDVQAYDADTAKTDVAQSWSAKQTFNNIIEIEKAIEQWNIVADNLASGDNNFDVLTNAVWYWTTAGDTNATLNFRGDGSNSLDSLLDTGDAITVAAILTHTGTAYYVNALKIDGSSVTPKWVDGTAPSAGSINALDVYTFTILKTASATFTVFAQKVKWDEA